MTGTTGNALVGRGRPDTSWIVRLGRTRPTRASFAAAENVILAGEAVDAATESGLAFRSVEVRLQNRCQHLELARDTIEIRCTPRDLPESSLAAPAPATDHVVHLICSRFEDPQAIERFLDATAHIERPWIGREAWLEVETHATSPAGAECEAPLVDDVFIARYPDIESWRELNGREDWVRASKAMEHEATTIFDLMIVPTVNRIAAFR